jgi:hypothetical protein
MPSDFKYSDKRYNRDRYNRLIDLKGVTLFKYLKNAGTRIFMRIMGALHLDGDLTVGGNNIKDRSGKTVISFNNTGGIDKIGDDTPSSGQFLKWDGSKAVWDTAAGTTYSAGTLLDLSTTTFNVDLTEAAAATIAAGDNIIFLDGGASGTASKGSINDVATLFAGTASATGLSASSGVLSVSDLHPVGVDGSANQLLTDDGDGTITSEGAATLSSSISTTRLELMSPANSGDKLSIEVAGQGATTITTVDADTTQADLTISADGDITLTTPDKHYSTSIKRRKMTLSSSSDHDHDGDVVYFGTGSTVMGEICYLYKDGSNNPVWIAAQANAESTSTSLLAIALGTDPDTDGMLLRGMYTLDHNTGDDNFGDPVYLSDTAAGDTISTAPSSNNDVVRVIGYKMGNDDEIWFCPDNTWVVVSA